ncbi:hypothetical protein MHLP_04120 [Candidatus Mycoplasma haematolamae str. Purdue]|uniref:Uncharacterized protein n=1 Tax=Mycoplasma haematolamae (strain Purdue) TaxID=1212765 RepID=I7CKI2_MYCHA|nr:hypothetical protein [Candidatus Mycoplasma haematolamae]AFO52404.1 hypothetical protein MHLP_04120 [Candidatus Mycoplasma haematolamae str. Purdue]
MVTWAKYALQGIAFFGATGTAAKVTYAYTMPTPRGKSVKVKLNSSQGKEVTAQLPETLDIEIPSNSKLQMKLGKSNSGNGECIEITYNGVSESSNQGGLYLLGAIEAETYLSNMPLCGNKHVWTIINKKTNDSKKLVCDHEYVLGVDQTKKHLKCELRRAEDLMNEQKYEVALGDKPNNVVCTRKPNTYQVTCESNQDFSLKYTAISNGKIEPALEIATP